MNAPETVQERYAHIVEEANCEIYALADLSIIAAKGNHECLPMMVRGLAIRIRALAGIAIEAGSTLRAKEEIETLLFDLRGLSEESPHCCRSTTQSALGDPAACSTKGGAA